MTVILVAHILASIILVTVVLMQRSEGGALGIGGGGGGGGLVSGRGVAGVLSRTTIIFGAIFFATSLVLTTIATKREAGGRTQIEQNLIEEFDTQADEDDLGIGDIGDILAPNSDLLEEDPLAVVPMTPDDSSTPDTPPPLPNNTETATDQLSDDPLSEPQK